MEVHVSHIPALWVIILGALLVFGLAVAVGGMGFAIVRRRGSLGGNLVLFAAAAVGLCLILMLALSSGLYWVRGVDYQEDVRRAELQARLRQMGEELHASEALEYAQHVPIEPPSPIEAPRPDAEAGYAFGDAERLVDDSPPLPEWVTSGTIEDGDGKLVVVRGQQFADPTTAWQDALQKAKDLVQQDFNRSYSQRWGELAPDAAFVEHHAVRDSHTEEIQRTAGDNDFTVYRTQLLVELSPRVRNALEPVWREHVSRERSFLVVGLLALLTAIAGVASGYFRLDERTQGRYRWRLRFAALAATVLVGGTLFAGTRIASNAVRPKPDATPPTTVDLPAAPPDARLPQVEASVGNVEQARFRAVADRIVDAINAGDYEGVRRDFNETMLDTFPVEKCRAFFGEKISGKYGKINELEPPQFKSDAVAIFKARCERGTLNFILVLDEHGQVAGLLLRPGSDLPVPEKNQTKLVPVYAP